MEQKIKPRKKSQSNLAKLYLFAYNGVETLGWSLLLFNVITFYTSGSAKGSLFEHVKWLLIIFPNSALLEILHAATGMVPSSPIVTAQQVYARVLLVCGVVLPTLAAKESIGFTVALLSWSFAEIFRYSFYALNLLNAAPWFLVWLRYSIFLVIFPLGLFGELLMIYAAQQEFGQTGMWSLKLPNWCNFTFNYQYFLIFNLIGFVLGFPKLYFHMVAQRKKVLGGSTTEKKSS